MKKHHILLLTGLLIMTSLSGCCWFFDCHTHKYRGQFTICQQLLNEYSMTIYDLQGLNVSLNQELMIKRLYPDQQGKATSNFRTLKLVDKEYYEFIRFKKNYVGTIVKICDPKFDLKTKIRQIFGELPRKVLVVQFEEGWTLSFITTDSGGFELMTLPGGKQMMYQNKKYTCVYGGSGNSLVVDGDYFYDFYMHFKDPDGKIFKDYDPKHWR